MAAGSGVVEGAAGAGGADPPMAPTAGTLGGVVAMGHQHTRLAGGPRSAVISDRHDRRCHLTSDGVFCGARFDGGEPADIRQLCAGTRAAAGGLHRQGQSVPDCAPGSASPASSCAAAYADRTSAGGTRYRVDRCSLAASQRAGGTLLRYRARPAGERPAQSGGLQPGTSQSLSPASVSAAVERALQLRRGASRRCASCAGPQGGTGFGVEPGGGAQHRAGLHRALERSDLSDAAGRHRRRHAWPLGGDRTAPGSDAVDALETEASSLSKLHDGKETQLPRRLDSAPGGTET